MRWWCVALAMVSVALGCVEERAPLGTQCERNTDCQSPLVCRLARCRVECGSTRDCPIGSLCVPDDVGGGVCLLPDERECTSGDDCPGNVECIDGRCTESCTTDRDCPPGSFCEGEEGQRGCEDPSGIACSTSRECPMGLRCTADGRCRTPCRAPRDCRLGETCTDGNCEPIASTTDAGTDPDGGGGDGGADGGADAGGVVDGGVDSGMDAGPMPECTMASDCTAPNVAEPGCVMGRCTIVGCASGFADCDGTFATGCELDVTADVDNCGTCGGRCGMGGTCTAGVCDTLVDVSYGLQHMCLVRSTGTVLCVGRNAAGELGRSTVTPTPREPLGLVMMLTDGASVDVGAGGTCVRRTGGGVACMGDGAHGQLGNGSTTIASLPVNVTGLSDATAITMGGDHMRTTPPTGPPLVPVDAGFACALRMGGAVSCWGGAVFRGDGGATDSSVPVVVPTLTDAVDLAAGQRHVCAVRTGGSVVCWGERGARLGPMGSANTGVPVVVTGITDARRIDASTIHTCAARTGGAVSCWGDNTTGQLGVDSTATPTSSTPIAVPGITDATDVDVGQFHGCALRTGGSVSCWGFNLGGELGDGTTMARTGPVAAVGLTDASVLTVGNGRTCVIRTNGALACWGGLARDYGAPGLTRWTSPTDHPDFPPTPTP